MSHDEGVRIERLGRVGRIVLDRPRALNALTLTMVERIHAALDAWRHDPDLRAVTVESASERAFCAGGDIRRVRENTLAGRHDESLRFFTTEYAVNALLGAYPVPVVALVGGLCLGGGMGLSVHGPFRVVGPDASFAMPETKIGFFPDVGATHFLPRLPGAVGRYLGLTGARVGAADALALGLATHACSAADLARLPALIDAHDGPLETLLRSLAPADALDQPGPLSAVRADIDRVFGAADLAGVRDRLDALDSDWAKETRAALDAASPASLALTDRLLAEGRERDLPGCLAAELDAARTTIASPDFVEGVRAVLVDKDHAPRWAATPTVRPATTADLDAIFAIRTSVTENHLSREQLTELGITADALGAVIADGPECLWVAEVAGIPAGFAMVDTDDACVFACFVGPEHEGSGLGRLLMERAESALLAHHPVIWLTTDGASRAAGFYRRLGWTAVTDLPDGDLRFEKRREGTP
ncbi:3-hydroxyisobutyryl-CoA hydrolase [Nocardioides sp. WV_118_6]